MKYTFLIVFLTIFISCNNNKRNNKLHAIKYNQGKKVHSNLFDNKENSFSSIFTKVSEVELKSDNDHLISKVKKVIITKKNYIVADGRGKQLLVFDKNGNYKNSIGRIGKAPGEFESVFDIAVSTKNQILLLDVNLQRVTKYTITGAYLNSFKIQPGFNICSDLNGGFYLYNPTESAIAEGITIKHYSNTGKIDYKFCKPFFSVGMVGGNIVRDSRGNLFVIHSSEYIIKKYAGNGEYLFEFGNSPKYYIHLDVKKNNLPSPKKLKEFTPLMKIAVNKKYIFVELGRAKPKTAWLDIYDIDGSLLVSGVKLPSDIYLAYADNINDIIYFIKIPPNILNTNVIPNYKILGYLIK